MSRFEARARLGTAMREAALDGPGLLTVPRLQQLYAAGRIPYEALDRGLDIALHRKPRTPLHLLSNEQIDRLPAAE